MCSMDNIQIEVLHFQLVLEQNDVVHQCVLFVCGEWDSWSMISHLDYRIESPSFSSHPCILNPSSIWLSIWFLLWLAYSASMVDNAIIGCHLLLQEIAPLPIMKTNRVVDLLSSRSSPQFASQYPSTSLDGVAPNCNFICNVPCKCRKIRLMAIQCSMLGFFHVLTQRSYWVCQVRSCA